MPKKDPRFEDYIDRAAPYAQPILLHLRRVIHQACPAVVESIKWQHLFFEYAGSNLCQMAAFKQHCVFGFWLQSKMKDPHKIFPKGEDKVVGGQLGRITRVSDLPSDKVLKEYIKEAMVLLDQGVKLSRPKSDPTNAPSTEIPSYLAAALKKNKAALEHFRLFSPSAKKEYVEWLTEAKTEPTRLKRLDTAIEWIAEGKTRHWKYK